MLKRKGSAIFPAHVRAWCRAVRWVSALSLILLGQASAAPCPAASRPQAITGRLQAAETAFAALEADGFAMAMDEVALLLPCLDTPLSLAEAAHTHRMMGVWRFAAGAENEALQSLATARTLAPDYRFPEALFPEGHGLVVAYDALVPGSEGWLRVPVPAEGSLVLDGEDSLRRPEGRATLFHHIDDAGQVRTTAYLFPADPLPAYTVLPRLRNRLIWVTAASALGAGVAGAVAVDRRTQFEQDDPSMDLDELEHLRAQANGAAVAAQLLVVTATGGGIAAILVGRR